ncbi:MAG: hypothetical protein IJS47_04885 [Clostridia bacterium]|nr:hypothetical protein [Clostridia bacterium]
MQKSYKNHVQASVKFCNGRSIKIVDFHERISYNKSIENRKTGDKKMKNQEIRNTVAELQDLYAKADELKAQIVEREQAIKDEMDNRELEVLDLGNVIIRFTSILSNRFDTTAFKKLHTDLYNTFIKQVASRRFVIA